MGRAAADRPCSPPGERLADIRSTPVQLTLDLDASIYQAEAVARSAAAFDGLARIVVQAGAKRQVVYFAEAEADVRARLVDEFANYALGSMVVEP